MIGILYNISRLITLLYHLHIEYEIYNLEYNKRKGILNVIVTTKNLRVLAIIYYIKSRLINYFFDFEL